MIDAKDLLEISNSTSKRQKVDATIDFYETVMQQLEYSMIDYADDHKTTYFFNLPIGLYKTEFYVWMITNLLTKGYTITIPSESTYQPHVLVLPVLRPFTKYCSSESDEVKEIVISWGNPVDGGSLINEDCDEEEQ